MKVPFEDMRGSSRVWIYQADRKLSGLELQKIDAMTDQFVREWAAHGQALKSSHKILHDQFLIISVDEDHNKASGCSIDSSMKFIQYLEQQFNLSFTDRTNIAVMDGTSVRLIKLSEIKSLIESNNFSDKTLIFNNLVTNVDQWKNDWLTPASNTWLKKYFA